MNQSSCKRDTKSRSPPSMKLAPVLVFSCKIPLIYTNFHTQTNVIAIDPEVGNIAEELMHPETLGVVYSKPCLWKLESRSAIYPVL